jgi:hypothetical protein
MAIEARPVVRKQLNLYQEEVKTLDDAVKVGIADDAMGAIHIAIDLLRGHVEAKKMRWPDAPPR